MKLISFRFLFLLTLLTFSFGTNAADGTVNGRFVDANGNPVGFVTVYLTGADGEMALGSSADEQGFFHLNALAGDYTLHASLVGYKEHTSRIRVGGNIITIPDIILEEDSELLSAATVEAVMPKTKVTPEGLQTSIRGSVLENVGNAVDALERTPGMIKGQNGLEVIGRGAPLIYINGHKVTDSSELDRLRSSEIQSIEVINNPGAQYDASVRSVVRIKTIKMQGEGFGLSFDAEDQQSLRKASINDPNAQINVNYRIKGVDVFAGANLFKFTSRQVSNPLYQKTLDTPEFEVDGNLESEYFQNTAYFTGGMNWQISQNHSVGFKINHNNRFYVQNDYQMWEKLNVDGQFMDSLYTKGFYVGGDRNPYSTSANAYYNGTVGKMGIDFNLDYYGNGSSQKAEIKETSATGSDAVINTESASTGRLYAGKLVMTYPIWQGALQFGTEETFTRSEDTYKVTGVQIPSSDSQVSENNYALFASYAFALQKVGQFNAGLRYEHVDYDFMDNVGEGSFEKDYDNFFPTLSYSGAVKNVMLMANYGVKTTRPDFSMLSDAISYNNRYDYQSGNAALQPQYDHAFGITAMWNVFAFIANYDRVDNAIASWSQRYNTDGVILVKPENLEDPVRTLSLFVNATTTIGRIWNLNFTTGIHNQWLEMEFEDPLEPSLNRTLSFNGKPLFFVQMFNTLTLKKGWQIELGGEYHSRAYTQNIYITNQYLDLSAAIQKAFLKDGSLIIRLEGMDIAGLGHSNAYGNFGNHIIRQSNIMDTQRVKLSLRYKFNTTSSKYKGTGAGKDAISRMK